MDLVEEYLHIVAVLLPKAQREDIVAELRDTILTRIEAREAELGRKLTPDETEEVLREVGHPLLVAARYREGPQHVVGPALYPYWAFAVKVALTIIAVVAAVSFVVRLIVTGDAAFAFGIAVAPAIGSALTVVGFATIVAWIVERRGGKVHYLDNWRVRDLKGLEFLAWDFDTIRDRLAAGVTPPPPPRAPAFDRDWSRSDRRAWRHAGRSTTASHALGAIAFGAVFLLWWIGFLPFGLVSSPDQVRQLGFEPGPFAAVNWLEVRQMLFWPVLAYGVAVIVQGVVIWTHPRAVRLHGLVNLAIAGLVMAGVGWVWTDSPLSSSIHVDSVAGLLLQLKEAAHQPPPKPIGPFVALILACVAFGALGRAVHGLIQILFGRPPDLSADQPAAARSGTI